MRFTISLISENDDIEALLKTATKFNWDVVIIKDNGSIVPYQVYNIPEKIHTIKSWNTPISFWGHPLNEEPTYKNLIPMTMDHIISWTMVVEEKHVIIDKFRYTNEDTVRRIKVYRNSEEFCTIPCRDIVCGLAEAKTIITYLEEGPINVFERGFDQELIGREVLYNGKAYTITHYCDNQGCVILHPRFETSRGYEEPKVEIWDKKLYWD